MYGPIGRSPWLDIDWRAHQRWVIVDGQPVNTIELGADRASNVAPLVFIHGLSGSWPNWLEQLGALAEHPSSDTGTSAQSEGPDSLDRGRTRPRWLGRRRPGPSNGHRVLALDLPGFGCSPRPASRISISRYVSLVDRLLDQLDIDSATLIGNSMGGLIAAELAISFPQRAERLVLISPAGISTYDRPVRGIPALRRLEPIAASFTTWIAARSDTVTRRPRLRNLTMYTLVRHPDRLPPPLAAEQMRGAGKPGFVQALEATLRYDVRRRLPEIACPTLIVWGDNDRVISVRDADVFAELIPNSRKVVFEDTGHMAMLERPAAFNALLEEFLSA